jgi:hypothetical protein
MKLMRFFIQPLWIFTACLLKSKPFGHFFGDVPQQTRPGDAEEFATHVLSRHDTKESLSSTRTILMSKGSVPFNSGHDASHGGPLDQAQVIYDFIRTVRSEKELFFYNFSP